MTETAATTPEGQPASAPVDAATAPAAAPVDATQQAAADQDAQKGDATKGEQAQGAPEKYELAIPEGLSLDESGMEAFSQFAKSQNLTNEAAQSLLDTMGPAMAKRQAQVLDTVRTQWADSARSDKEFGGEKLSENLSVAKRALDAYGSPELRSLLNESGLGNHPEVIRFFVRAGKAISQDTFVAGSPVAKAAPGSMADYASGLYPTQH